MRGQVFWAFSVDEARAVAGIEVGPDAPGEIEIEAGGECVALVVVEEEITFVRRGEIGKTTGYSSSALRVLMGVSGVELGAPGDPGRVCRGFPAAVAAAIKWPMAQPWANPSATALAPRSAAISVGVAEDAPRP